MSSADAKLKNRAASYKRVKNRETHFRDILREVYHYIYNFIYYKFNNVFIFIFRDIET